MPGIGARPTLSALEPIDPQPVSDVAVPLLARGRRSRAPFGAPRTRS